MILLSSELSDANGDGEAAANGTVLEDPSFRAKGQLEGAMLSWLAEHKHT